MLAFQSLAFVALVSTSGKHFLLSCCYLVLISLLSVLASPFKTEKLTSRSFNPSARFISSDASLSRNGIRAFTQSERRSAYDQARRNRHARRDLAVITALTTALQEVDQNLAPVLSALNTTVAAATASSYFYFFLFSTDFQRLKLTNLFSQRSSNC